MGYSTYSGMLYALQGTRVLEEHDTKIKNQVIDNILNLPRLNKSGIEYVRISDIEQVKDNKD